MSLEGAKRILQSLSAIRPSVPGDLLPAIHYSGKTRVNHLAPFLPKAFGMTRVVATVPELTPTKWGHERCSLLSRSHAVHTVKYRRN